MSIQADHNDASAPKAVSPDGLHTTSFGRLMTVVRWGLLLAYAGWIAISLAHADTVQNIRFSVKGFVVAWDAASDFPDARKAGPRVDLMVEMQGNDATADFYAASNAAFAVTAQMDCSELSLNSGYYVSLDIAELGSKSEHPGRNGLVRTPITALCINTELFRGDRKTARLRGDIEDQAVRFRLHIEDANGEPVLDIANAHIHLTLSAI